MIQNKPLNYADYDIFIGRIKHQFVNEIDAKSRQMVITDIDGVADIDINSLSNSLKELSLNEENGFSKSTVNRSGLAWIQSKYSKTKKNIIWINTLRDYLRSMRLKKCNIIKGKKNLKLK